MQPIGQLNIEVNPIPMDAEQMAQHKLVYECVKNALDAEFKGKNVNLRAMIEALVAIQIGAVMRGGKVNQDKAFQTVMHCVATFHAHFRNKEGTRGGN